MAHYVTKQGEKGGKLKHEMNRFFWRSVQLQTAATYTLTDLVCV